MRFSMWTQFKEMANNPNMTPQQKYSVWKQVWPRLLPNEKWIIGSELYNMDQNLFKRVTGQQNPGTFRGNPQQAVV